jgi:hypothetical protein
MKPKVAVIAVSVLVILAIIVITLRQPTNHSPIVTTALPEKPYAFVSLMVAQSSDPDVAAGSRELNHAAVDRNLPSVLDGLNALCSEIEFGADGSRPSEWTIVIQATSAASYEVAVAKSDTHKIILNKTYQGPTDVYAAACGAVRGDLQTSGKSVRKSTSR